MKTTKIEKIIIEDKYKLLSFELFFSSKSDS